MSESRCSRSATQFVRCKSASCISARSSLLILSAISDIDSVVLSSVRSITTEAMFLQVLLWLERSPSRSRTPGDRERPTATTAISGFPFGSTGIIWDSSFTKKKEKRFWSSIGCRQGTAADADLIRYSLSTHVSRDTSHCLDSYV